MSCNIVTGSDTSKQTVNNANGGLFGRNETSHLEILDSVMHAKQICNKVDISGVFEGYEKQDQPDTHFIHAQLERIVVYMCFCLSAKDVCSLCQRHNIYNRLKPCVYTFQPTWARMAIKAFCRRNVLFPRKKPNIDKQHNTGKWDKHFAHLKYPTTTYLPPIFGPVTIHNLCLSMLQLLLTKPPFCRVATTGCSPPATENTGAPVTSGKQYSCGEYTRQWHYYKLNAWGRGSQGNKCICIASFQQVVSGRQCTYSRVTPIQCFWKQNLILNLSQLS